MIKPSAGVSNTMSASFRPLCGRAPSGSLPTFTASAGRSGTPSGALTSVRGQKPGATVNPGGVVVVVVVGASVVVVEVVPIASRGVDSPDRTPAAAAPPA